MPFTSKRQARAAFGGYLGKEMKKKAPEWASKTDFKNLPMKKKSKKVRKPGDLLMEFREKESKAEHRKEGEKGEKKELTKGRKAAI